MDRDRMLLCTMLAAAALWCAGPALAQDSQRSEPLEPVYVDVVPADGTRHLIDEIQFEYLNPTEGQPSAEQLLETGLVLARAEDGWVAPREGEPIELIRLADIPDLDQQHFYDSALPLIAPAVVQRLQNLGLIGVYVEPDREDLRVEGGRIVDARPEGDGSLTLEVTTGIVVDVRSNALGERVPEDLTLNNPVHARLRCNSPVQPASTEEAAREGTQATSLLRRDLIDRYVYHLNRHPGRRVDVAVVPSGEEFGGVSVDYLVTENRPWLFFGQVANNGTGSTGGDFRWRFGFIHNQLSNADDIFSIDYLTGDFDDLHAVTTSYERPLLDYDRLRWRVYGSWYTYTAEDLGQALADFEGDGYTIGGEMRWNFFQQRDLFLDLIGGLRYSNVEVDNELVGESGEEGYLVPSIGVRLERVRQTEQTRAGISIEGNVADVNGDELERLGRFDPDENWALMRYDASHSFYLEPLFADEDEPTPLAHELFLELRGQLAFDDRLIPNEQQIVGGLYTVRGYPQALTAGDTVFLGTVEYRYHVPQGLSPAVSPGGFFGQPFRYAPQYTSGPTDWDLVLKGFFDIGRSVLSQREAFESNETLISVGIGAELIITRRFRARVDWGIALEDVDGPSASERVDSGDSEVHFVITLIF